MIELPETAVRMPVAVDIVALTVQGQELMVLLATRLLPPYQGSQCLPGGFVLAGETLEAAALREFAEEAGMDAAGHLEQLRTYGPLRRDPRGPVVSVAYLALSAFPGEPQAGGDAESAGWVPVRSVGHLAFDHDVILADGVERARSKLEYTGLATAFCDAQFSVSQLRSVYETVWGQSLDPRNFNRKITGTVGFIEPVATRKGQPGRPATMYQLASDRDPAGVMLNPPVMRPVPANDGSLA